MTSIFTASSLLCKISSSSSGILYPKLYEINNNLITPFALGVTISTITLFIAFVIFYLDSKADKYEQSNFITVGDDEIERPEKK